MKNINKISLIINKTSIWLFVMLLTISTAFAAEPDALPDAPNDTAAAPIDDYVLLLAIIGVSLAFIRFRAIKAKQIKRQNRTS